MVALSDELTAPGVVLHPVVKTQCVPRVEKVYCETIAPLGVLPSKYARRCRRTQVELVLACAMYEHGLLNSGRHEPVEHLVVVPLLPYVGRPFNLVRNAFRGSIDMVCL